MNTSIKTRSVDVPTLIATLLIGAMAAALSWPQIFPSAAQANEPTLPNLSKRADTLRQISDPLRRDQMCIGLSAYGRALDKAISKDARVFMSGAIGKENA